VDPGDELYLVALCGDHVDVALDPVGVVAGTDEAHELARRLVEAERTAARWHDAFQETRKTSEWMASTYSWRITRPFRLPGRLRRRG